jgi:hypothetical protein
VEFDVISPKFGARSQLARYIDEDHRLSGNRAAVAAFLPDPFEKIDSPDENHFSVNSLEIETISEITAYHRWKWQKDSGKVAICIHKVLAYNDVAKKCGVQIGYDRQTLRWMFLSKNAKFEQAYRHRPVPRHNNPLASPSHCGVEFVRAFNEHTQVQFARRMSNKGRFHLL